MNENWLYLTLFALVGWLVINAVRFVIILLHELGHALPALYFTRGPVTVYIGSYGEDEGPKIRLGHLTIRIKPRLSYLRAGGMCKHEAVPSAWQNIVIIVAGPVITFLIALLLFPFVLYDGLHGSLKIVIVLFFFAALISLVHSLYPRKLEYNAELYSDGQLIANVLKLKTANKYLFKAAAFFEHDQFRETLAELDKIDKRYLNEYIASLYIQCYVELKQFGKLTEFKEKYMNAGLMASLTSYNAINLSFANIQLKEYPEALALLNKAIDLDDESYYAYNNRGFVHNLLGNYASAKADLDKACKLDPNAAYSVTNRAYANIKLGLMDEALVDINRSMELNEHNAYIYLVQGMYQLETGRPGEALANFEKAKNMEATTVLVDDYIALAKSKLLQP
ncbi:site-2 protease family protein [Mucilaginibacter psychrotolerans]|uniref:Peptidase M50 domain-containing protein n=1 Tax=Mucilaginibacter psychrotolerans TaxID=1524096 RepID=A0A4Y8S3S5_9SPHI|nr:site-2 protease family protein [Mucilaginibacter psychrotolerans]TFF33592.1 hypothetical protein E2R66_25290 [Mucilaginibacter psychrotolerans]